MIYIRSFSYDLQIVAITYQWTSNIGFQLNIQSCNKYELLS